MNICRMMGGCVKEFPLALFIYFIGSCMHMNTYMHAVVLRSPVEMLKYTIHWNAQKWDSHAY
jgi:hypothetical protein